VSSLLKWIQTQRPDVTSLKGPDQNGEYAWDDQLPDQQQIRDLIASYDPSWNAVETFVKNTVQQNLEFSLNLIQRMKERNILQGLSSIDQASWIHHRLRKTPFILSDGTTEVFIDLLNLVISGDVETAYVVLGQMQADDMTQPYHWLNQERIDWMRNEIAVYLGWA